jgi:hypothetical protein
MKRTGSSLKTFFWKLALTKVAKTKSHRSFGDGTPSGNSAGQLTRLLTRFTRSVVSVDGYKSSFLMKAYRKSKKDGRKHLVVIGHSRALSEFALSRLDRFLGNLDAGDEVSTFATVA